MAGMGSLDVVSKWLLVIGGLNWGLTGLGEFLKTKLNIVHMVLGSISMLENVVYVLVGVAAVLTLVGMFKK